MDQELTRSAKVTNETENLRQLRDFVQDVLDPSPFDRTQRNQIILAVDEAVANVIEHGYKDTGEGEIEVNISLSDHRLEVVVRDTSEAFDPTTIDQADVMEHIREGKKKGLGMFLMRKIMDEIVYSYEERNELKMVKHIEADEE